MENNPSIQKRKILLADDSVTIHKVVSLTFANEDIEVVAVGDGDAAMRKFNEISPDLVMIDVNMPGPDGYQICEAIKEDDQTKHIPVILLVGSFEPFDEEKARQVGADDFLTKPFQSILQLVNKVSDLLKLKTEEEDFLAPLEHPMAQSGNDADFRAVPLDEFDTAESSIENLGDAGMDDEMIQTAQFESSTIDETPADESPEVFQSFVEDLDRHESEAAHNIDPANDYPPHEDWAETQPLSKEEFEEIVRDGGLNSTERDSDLGSINLLEFSHTTSDENLPEADASPEFQNEKPDDHLTEEIELIEETDSSDTLRASDLSPAAIEAIADRVVEKLSNRIVEKIALEVAAQLEKKE